MIITDYYKFERLATQKRPNKNRLDCTASTNSYHDIKLSHIYIGENRHTKAGTKRKSDLAMTSGAGKHITSIYKPDLERGFAYGDIRGTTDLLLFVTSDFGFDADGRILDCAVIEVFICRGKKSDKNAIFNLLTDGELENEINAIWDTVTKSVTQK